jgi:DNA-binding response OmpR family regulator
MARILLVEDEPLWRRVLERRLIAAGHEVICAENGRAALRRLALSARLPDLVLTDLCMPEASGFELCAALRADPRAAALPIVVMSALDTPARRASVAANHVTQFLVKPLAAGEVLAAIEVVLQVYPHVLSVEWQGRGAG